MKKAPKNFWSRETLETGLAFGHSSTNAPSQDAAKSNQNFQFELGQNVVEHHSYARTVAVESFKPHDSDSFGVRADRVGSGLSASDDSGLKLEDPLTQDDNDQGLTVRQNQNRSLLYQRYYGTRWFAVHRASGR